MSFLTRRQRSDKSNEWIGHRPASLNADMLRDKGYEKMPRCTADAVTIPGAIDAFCQLNDDWGKLGLDALLAPSIHYATEGVPVAPRVGHDWAQNVNRLQGAAQQYFSFGGNAPKVGDLFHAPGQAEVLSQIAKIGREGFYSGAVAEDMVSSLRALGGKHSIEDFANQKAFYTDPIRVNYKDTDLMEHPPNGSGATAILMLNILSHFDLASLICLRRIRGRSDKACL